jgi:5-methylcytosine-specific restriction enzyme A
MALARPFGTPAMADHVAPYVAWYSLDRWRRRSRYQLQIHPLCAMCLQRGLVVPATIAHHVIPHRGDWNEFVLGELQSLCKPCHDGPAKTRELRGYDTTIGTDGLPVDPMHPVYRR